MQLDFHTKASGEFEILKPSWDGTLVSVAKTKNLITNYGLSDVKNALWANCFTKLIAGAGTTPPQVTDTTIQSFLVGTALYGGAGAPDSSTTITTSNVTMTRVFQLTNTTGSSITINELGTTRAATLNSSSQLFSRAIISPGVVVGAGQSITVLYRFNLAIPGATTSSFSFVNASAPTNSAGIITGPIASILTNGTTEAMGFPNAESKVFEPSLMRSQGCFGFTNGVTTSMFAAARSSYLNNPSSYVNNSDAIPNPSLINTTTVDVGSFAQQSYAIISPGTIPALGAFAFYARNVSGSSTSRNTGLHCSFNSAYTIPTNHYVKLTFNQSWGRA